MDLPSYLLGKNAGGGGGGTGKEEFFVLDHTQYPNNIIYLKGLKKGIYCWDNSDYTFTFKWDEETGQHPRLSNVITVNGYFMVLMDIDENIANNTTIVHLGETNSKETDPVNVNTKYNSVIKKDSNEYKLSISNSQVSKDVAAGQVNQTIYGVKTFVSLPESSDQPTTNNQLVTKSYVDSKIIVLTETEYNNLSTYADNTEYHIIEG